MSGAPVHDPLGWVRSPPSVMVKVHGVTSREALNGQLGVVLQYLADRQRYVLHMILTQEQVSLRADNLTKASFWEQGLGQYQLLRYDPTIRRQMHSYYGRLQSMTGLRRPEYLGIVALFLLGLSFYFLGFTRTMMLISMILLILTVMGPDLVSPHVTFRSALQNIPWRLRTAIREQIPVVGPRIADNHYLTGALVAFILVLFIQAMITPANRSSSSVPSAPGFGGTTSSAAAGSLGAQRRSLLTWQQQQEFYKLGFEDAMAQEPFGKSLPPEPPSVTGVEPSSPVLYGEEESSYLPSSPGGASTSRGGGWFQQVGTLLSVGYLASTLAQLARDPVTGQLSVANLRANAMTMEPWRLGLLGYMLYNVIRKFM